MDSAKMESDDDEEEIATRSRPRDKMSDAEKIALLHTKTSSKTKKTKLKRLQKVKVEPLASHNPFGVFNPDICSVPDAPESYIATPVLPSYLSEATVADLEVVDKLVLSSSPEHSLPGRSDSCQHAATDFN